MPNARLLSQWRYPLGCGVISVSTMVAMPEAVAQCDYGFSEWHRPGIDMPITAMATIEEGGKSVLYVGGCAICGYNGNALRRWDGRTWTNIGGASFFGPITCLETLDLGDGPSLYVGGDFMSYGEISGYNIARWDGTLWHGFGSGLSQRPNLITCHTDFRGVTTLVAATDIGVSQWNGVEWSSIASTNAPVLALTVHDDGSGPAMFAAGEFTHIGGQAFSRIAKWNGQSWSPVGEGVSGGNETTVLALQSARVGTEGAQLIVAGRFALAGDVAAVNIARWDASGWHAFPGDHTLDFEVTRLFAPGNAANSPFLIVAGQFSAAPAPLARVCAWNGSRWSTIPGDLIGDWNGPSVEALATFDDGSGSGEVLWVGGRIERIGPSGSSIPAGNLARWNGSQWFPPPATGEGLGGRATELLLCNNASSAGPSLFVGGSFITAGSDVVNNIARWDGADWTALAQGVNGKVDALAEFDDGQSDGTSLYAGGEFTAAGDIPANHVARWNGRTWMPLGSGLGGTEATVHDMIVFTSEDDQPSLVVAGQFNSAGGAPAYNIARWDGAKWLPMGAGISGSADALIRSLEVFDDGLGDGPALYAAGKFHTAGDEVALSVARWNGMSWDDVGAQIDSDRQVADMAVFDDGSGNALYVAGDFAHIGGIAASGLARWNGGRWSAVGSIHSNGGQHGRSLAVFDDGSGPALFVSGFRLLHTSIARWNGQKWAGLAGYGYGESDAMLGVAKGSLGGPALLMADYYLTQWSSGFPDAISLDVISPSQTAHVGQYHVSMTVHVRTGGAVTAQWRRNGVPISNEPNTFGQSEASLDIYQVKSSHAGVYDVVLSNDCETIVSPSMTLTVTCPGDIAPEPGGNSIVDMDDLLLVIASWGYCPGCSADVHEDSVVNQLDLISLMARWGHCP